ncbi:hypothetical protein [Haloferula sp.]
MKNVAPRKELVFKVSVTPEYSAKAFVGKALVDSENDKKKTGL